MMEEVPPTPDPSPTPTWWRGGTCRLPQHHHQVTLPNNSYPFFGQTSPKACLNHQKVQSCTRLQWSSILGSLGTNFNFDLPTLSRTGKNNTTTTPGPAFHLRDWIAVTSRRPPTPPPHHLGVTGAPNHHPLRSKVSPTPPNNRGFGEKVICEKFQIRHINYGTNALNRPELGTFFPFPAISPTFRPNLGLGWFPLGTLKVPRAIAPHPKWRKPVLRKFSCT